MSTGWLVVDLVLGVAIVALAIWLTERRMLKGRKAEIERLKSELAEANAKIKRKDKYIGRLIDGPAETAEILRKERDREAEEIALSKM